jgi:hypothetical protein
MIPRDVQQVYDEIVAHITKQGGAYSTWYCGIASSVKARLFDDHNVPQKDYWYIASQCYDSDDARKVEDKLLRLGCDGGAGGGDQTTVYVYAYLKGTMTNP